MKTVKNVLIVAMMLTIMTSYAEEIEEGDSVNLMTKLEFLDVKRGHQLIIKDHQGDVLHKEAIKRNGSYSNNFDLTVLKDGYYTVELSKDFEILIRPFKMDSKTVIFLTDQYTKVFKPYVRLDNNKLLVSQLVLDEEPLKVELYYNDESIYKEQIVGEKILQRIYVLSKIEKGYYHVVMTSGDREFSQEFKL